MIRTTRCRLCGQVVDAFVEFVPGLPLGLSQQAADNRIEASRIRHAERCPGRAEMKTTDPNIESAEPERVRARRRPLPAVWGRRREAG
jgi:hypothetical protein